MADRSGEQPLDLRSLADVDSPEVVTRALKRFRRRLVLFALIGVLVATAAVMIVQAQGPTSPLDRFAAAEGEDIAAVLRDGSAEAVVLRAARVDDTSFTVHLVLLADELRSGESVSVGSVSRGEAAPWGSLPGGGCLQVDMADAGRAREMWITAPAGTHLISLDVGAIRVSQQRGRAESAISLGDSTEPCKVELAPDSAQFEIQGTIELDMETLGVPDWIWRDER